MSADWVILHTLLKLAFDFSLFREEISINCSVTVVAEEEKEVEGVIVAPAMTEDGMTEDRAVGEEAEEEGGEEGGEEEQELQTMISRQTTKISDTRLTTIRVTGSLVSNKTGRLEVKGYSATTKGQTTVAHTVSKEVGGMEDMMTDSKPVKLARRVTQEK